MEQKNNKKKKRFRLYDLFNPEGNGKGVQKLEEGPADLGRFFKLYGRNITNMLYMNLLMLFGNFPILLGLFSGNFNRTSYSPSSPIFAHLYGMMDHISGAPAAANPVIAAIFNIHGRQSSISINTTMTYVFYALTLLVIFTYGPVNIGINYICRSIVKCEPVSAFSDFFYAIKKNFKQGLILGIIDIAFTILFLYDLYFFIVCGYQMFFYAMLIIVFGYIMMRFYIYMLAITFELSIWKIIKNSLIFTFINIKRNILAFSGILAMVVIEFIIVTTFFPLSFALPTILFFSTSAFMGAYAAYPKIKEVMIDPQIKAAGTAKNR